MWFKELDKLSSRIENFVTIPESSLHGALSSYQQIASLIHSFSFLQIAMMIKEGKENRVGARERLVLIFFFK